MPRQVPAVAAWFDPTDHPVLAPVNAKRIPDVEPERCRDSARADGRTTIWRVPPRSKWLREQSRPRVASDSSALRHDAIVQPAFVVPIGLDRETEFFADHRYCNSLPARAQASRTSLVDRRCSRETIPPR